MILTVLYSSLFLINFVICAPIVDELKSVTISGVSRSYHLYVPSSSPTSLMFLIHDSGQNATHPLEYWGWKTLADANNMVLLIPEAQSIPCKSIELFGQSIVKCYDGEEGVRWDIDHILTGITFLPAFANTKKCMSNDIEFLSTVKEDVLSLYTNIDKTYAVAQGNGAKFLVQASICSSGQLVDSMYCHMGGIGQADIDDLGDFIPDQFIFLIENSCEKITSFFWPVPLPEKESSKEVPILQTHVNFTTPKYIVDGLNIKHPDDTSAAVSLQEICYIKEIKSDLYLFPDNQMYYDIHAPMNSAVLEWLVSSVNSSSSRRVVMETSIVSLSQLSKYEPVGKYSTNLNTQSVGEILQDCLTNALIIFVGIFVAWTVLTLLVVAGVVILCCWCCRCKKRRKFSNSI